MTIIKEEDRTNVSYEDMTYDERTNDSYKVRKDINRFTIEYQCPQGWIYVHKVFAFNQDHAVDRLKLYLYPKYPESSGKTRWNNFADQMHDEITIRRIELDNDMSSTGQTWKTNLEQKINGVIK